jgi:hypothetical protein
METSWPLHGLTDDDRARLVEVAQRGSVQGGEAIIVAGERPGALLLIEQGEARVEVRGREIARVGPGSVVGEMSFASGDPATASVVATDALTFTRVSAADVAELTRADPGFSSRLYRDIARVIAERLRLRQEEWFEEGADVGELPVFEDGFEALRTATLPPLVVDAIERYRQVGDPQRAFLYRWAWHGLGVTCLDVVPDALREHVQITKLLMVVANVLFDDLADVPGHELEFQASIDRMMGVASGEAAAVVDGPYFELLFALWREIEDRARELPGWERHRLLYRFDYEQVFAAMRYVVLTRAYPGLVNLSEHRAYLPHSKNIMVFATLDLMAAGQRSSPEIGLVREAAFHAQALTQVANMVVTWRREVPARDFSSRIFALALDRGVLTRAELERLAPDEIVARIEAANVEAGLLEEMRAHRRRVAEVVERARAIDLRAYARAMEEVLAMELAARGLL